MAHPMLQAAFHGALQHHQAGRLSQAEALYRQVLAQQPAHSEALRLLGVIAHQRGDYDLALELIGQAIALEPASPEAHSNLGSALRRKGMLDEAIAAFRQAIALRPGTPETHNNLGAALRDKGFLDEAIAACRQAIALKPDFAVAYSNLGIALRDQGLLDESVAACRQAIALNPAHPEAYNHLGMVLKDQGELDLAIAAFEQAIGLDARRPEPHSNLLCALHYHPGYDAGSIAAAHLRWSRQHAAPLKRQILPHANERSIDRPLRIGYVSPHFRGHPVGRFLLPLLASHDHRQFAIFAYAQVPTPDALTPQLRAHTDQWHSLVGLSDEKAAELIRHHQIDILVDLTMHNPHHRLLVFARKPAPVQVTYLAYPSTTGLDTIDYRLSDPYLDPPGGDESSYSERTLRLPETYWCYQPPIATGQAGPLPALQAAGITFGCLNNFCKLSAPALQAWAKLLQDVPNSRLVLHVHEGAHRQRVSERLAADGIDPARLRFAAFMSIEKYFELYRQIDIALDPFPYGGGTTTCDALWMGVPVVSLAGKTAVGRGGLSILSTIGLPELVAHSPEEYVQIALHLANDLPRLGNLRSALRLRMQQSPLMDGPRFAGHVEAAYRQIWRQWCLSSRAQGERPSDVRHRQMSQPS